MAKDLNTPTKWSIAALFAVGVYFGLTWFFFGSSHPCGILEARQRPYVVKSYTNSALEILRAALEATKGADSVVSSAAFEQITKSVIEAPKRAIGDLHERIWNHYTPAGCLWEALAWNPDPYKGSPPLKDILKAGE